MAEIAVAPQTNHAFGDAKIYLWETITATNQEGSAVNVSATNDIAVQMLGDFGTSGDIVIQGSIDGGTTWATLNDPQGDPIVITAASIIQVQENVQLIRPINAAGTGLDLDVWMIVR